MSDTTNPAPEEKPAAPADTSAQELNSKIDAAQSQLAQAAAKLNSSATTTAVVGVILLLFICGYFGYGYSQIAPLAEPKSAVDFISGIVDDHLPELRKTAEQTVESQAPEWAKSVSGQIQGVIPEVRVKLEGYILEQTDKMVDELSVMSGNEFRKILVENREILETGFKELGQDEKMSKESIAALESALEKELQADMVEQAGIILETLNMLHEKVQVLSEGKMLNREQRLERRALMILRRLALAEADPDMADRKMNQASKGVEDLDQKAKKAAGDAKKTDSTSDDTKKADTKKADTKKADTKDSDSKDKKSDSKDKKDGDKKE